VRCDGVGGVTRERPYARGDNEELRAKQASLTGMQGSACAWKPEALVQHSLARELAPVGREACRNRLCAYAHSPRVGSSRHSERELNVGPHAAQQVLRQLSARYLSVFGVLFLILWLSLQGLGFCFCLRFSYCAFPGSLHVRRRAGPVSARHEHLCIDF